MQISANTTATGPINYNPYGYSTTLIQRPYSSGFNGAYLDIHTQCYHLGQGYRAYSPALRRFTSPDFISPFGRGGINAYAYCNGDPVNRIDPNGAIWGLAASRRYFNGGMKSPTKPAQQNMAQPTQVQQTRPISDVAIIAKGYEMKKQVVDRLMKLPTDILDTVFKHLRPGDLYDATHFPDPDNPQATWVQHLSDQAYLEHHKKITQGNISYHNDVRLSYLQRFYLERFEKSILTGNAQNFEISMQYASDIRKKLDGR